MKQWIQINRAGLMVLALTLSITAAIFFWLSTETTRDKIHRLTKEYFHLVLENRHDQASKLLMEALDQHIVDGKLDKTWAPLANQLENGYQRLQYAIPALAGSPEEEKYYAEIAMLLQMAPPAFHEQVKPRYLRDLAAIPGIRQDWMEKYGLLPESTRNQDNPSN